MASTHDVPNGSTPAELSEPGELNVSPSDLRSLVNRKRLRQYPSSKDDSEDDDVDDDVDRIAFQEANEHDSEDDTNHSGNCAVN